MKVLGSKKLQRQMANLPPALRKHVTKAMLASGEDGARVARVLAPVGESGETKDWIHVEVEDGGMKVSIEAGLPTGPSQRKVNSIEGGRKNGDRGTTEPRHYMGTARKFVAKKNAARIKRAINKAAKEAFNG